MERFFQNRAQKHIYTNIKNNYTVILCILYVIKIHIFTQLAQIN